MPIIANSGVGDVDSLINEYRAGALVHEFTKSEYHNAVKKVVSIKGADERLGQIAREKFDLLSVGGARYKDLYRELLNR